MSPDHDIDLYNSLAAQVWERMVNLVGVHTVTLLVQRALWLTRQKYIEAELIVFSESGISFEELRIIDRGQVRALMEEFISSLIGILTGLIGKEITEKLAREIDTILESTGGAPWRE
ncbi:MAG: hypothetical protein AB1767_12130 [Bacillota bacterium]